MELLKCAISILLSDFIGKDKNADIALARYFKRRNIFPDQTLVKKLEDGRVCYQPRSLLMRRY